jgi:hypothetical protein
VGYPLGWAKVGGSRGWVKEESGNLPPAGSALADEAADAVPADEPRRKPSFLVGCLYGLLGGAVAGALVGTVVLFGWVSLALRPLTSEGWRADIQTGFLGLTFRSGRVPLTLFGLGAAPFVLVGLVLGMAGQVRVR